MGDSFDASNWVQRTVFRLITFVAVYTIDGLILVRVWQVLGRVKVNYAQNGNHCETRAKAGSQSVSQTISIPFQ